MDTGKIVEGPVLFFSIVKWFVLAICVGGLVGSTTAYFLKGLAWSIQFTHQFPLYFWLLPFALLISCLLIDYLAPEAEGYGARVIAAVHNYSGQIPLLVPPVKFVATIITIAFGGSAGKTGPCVQIGAGVTSMFASILKLDANDHKKLVICGMSAAFASIFGTTLAGAIFGLEVLYMGALFYDVLFPAFIAGFVAYEAALKIGILYPVYRISGVPGLSNVLLGQIVLSGVLFGLGALLLIESLQLGGKICEVIPLWKPLKGIVGGGLLIALTYLFSEEYLGLSTSIIDSCLQGVPVAYEAFLLKVLFVTITLNFCGSGGIVTPILVIGASLGNLFGQMMGGDNLMFFTALGMVSLLAGAANTPLTASFMAIELFGLDIAPYAAIACVTSFLMAGHRTVYPSQILLVPKTASLAIETQQEVGNIHHMRVTTHQSGLFELLAKALRSKKPR